MNRVGPSRWDGRLLGVGVLGNMVLMLKMGRDYALGQVQDPSRDPQYAPQQVTGHDGEWISIFDNRFVEELDSMCEYCMNHDED